MLPAMNASGAGCHSWAPTNSANITAAMAVCVCGGLAHVCARMRACVMR